MLVSTLSGKVQGFEKDGAVQFRGVPYAAPPTGQLRFKAPAPTVPWDDVLDCTAHRASATQDVGGMEAFLGGSGSRIPTSEDCLYLNVFTPAADDAARPVMVWIHGGAFVSGSGSVPWYNGARLAVGGDVVVVTIIYRLGAWGFLHLEHLLGDAFAGSGNNGILDQVAALEWVRDNIAAFGGDPSKVTIFGESAGGMSVGTLLGLPAAKGLFKGAIAQSGAARNVLKREAAEANALVLLEHVGLDAAHARDLLEVPTDRLLEAQQAMVGTNTSFDTATTSGLALRLVPVVDDMVVPEAPIKAVSNGSADGVAVLTGTTHDECTLFLLMAQASGDLPDGKLEARCERIFGAGRGREAVERYRSAAATAAGSAGSNGDVWCAVLTDQVFRLPSIRLAETLAARGQSDTWMYRFDQPSKAFGGALRACHAVEIPFVFDNLHRRGVEQFIGPVTDEVQALARAMSRAWLAFAHHGDPNHEGLPDWPRYDAEQRATMLFDTPAALAHDPDGPTRELWAELI